MEDAHSATALAARIRHRQLSPIDGIEQTLERIDERDDLNAFVTVLESAAIERARELEAALDRSGPIGPLHGVPIAIKDLFDFKAGVRNTMGSVAFEAYVPEETAAYVERLEAAGAIVVGKTNTPELGHKGLTDNELIGPTSTPFDLSYNAGGSSGGSAAAVADGMVPIAQGTDGGGSVRIPAACCGIFGMKPSFGRIAQPARPDAFLGHTPFIHVGPLSRTVSDAALLLEVLCGPHPRDPLSIPDDGMGFREAVGRGIDDLQIAYSPNLDVFPIDERVERVVEAAVADLEAAGAQIEEIEIGLEMGHRDLADLWIRQIGALYHSTLEGLTADGTDLLADHREEMTPEFVSMLEETMDLSMRELKRDDHRRTQVFDCIQDVFESFDILLSPTLTVPGVKNAPPGAGSTVGPPSVNGEAVEPLIGWCLTHPFNFTGHPAASVPAGVTDDGLPVGLQVVGDRFADDDVIATSACLERIRPWLETLPPR